MLMNHNFFVLFRMTQIIALERVLRAYSPVVGAGGTVDQKEGFQMKTGSPIVRYGFSILFFSRRPIV